MKFEGKIVFTITDQSKIDPYSDFELWETLTVTFERLKRSPLGAAHAVGQIYEVPPPGSSHAIKSYMPTHALVGTYMTLDIGCMLSEG